MQSEVLIDQRLSVVEDAVAKLRRRLDDAVPEPSWIERFTGSFKDEPAFAEAVAHGRAFRSADRPPEDDKG